HPRPAEGGLTRAFCAGALDHASQQHDEHRSDERAQAHDEPEGLAVARSLRGAILREQRARDEAHDGLGDEHRDLREARVGSLATLGGDAHGELVEPRGAERFAERER
ncbi:MAG: hypothetical protein ACK56I_32820, partial [bacterium]